MRETRTDEHEYSCIPFIKHKNIPKIGKEHQKQNCKILLSPK